MLAIRMQRTGRKGHAMFRVIVQDAQRTPTSGKIVTRLGSYDPHTKAVTLDKEKAGYYLEHGAQPSERVALILKKEGVKLPDWVKIAPKYEGDVRNPEKRRSTRPEEPAEEAAPEADAATEAEAEAPAENAETETANEDTAPTEEAAEKTEDAEKPAEAEAPAEEPAKEEAKPAEEAEATPEEKPEAPEASDNKADAEDSEKAK